mmetsp:Transcript_23573/g.44843  ORF Transcript_23573/g.44843 Transcript_23573/m.44843 type:complete len:153 (-) Transcript_23573:1933-2391(-)
MSTGLGGNQSKKKKAATHQQPLTQQKSPAQPWAQAPSAQPWVQTPQEQEALSSIVEEEPPIRLGVLNINISNNWTSNDTNTNTFITYDTCYSGMTPEQLDWVMARFAEKDSLNNDLERQLTELTEKDIDKDILINNLKRQLTQKRNKKQHLG